MIPLKEREGSADQLPSSARPQPAAPGRALPPLLLLSRATFQERVVPEPPRRKPTTKKALGQRETSTGRGKGPARRSGVRLSSSPAREKSLARRRVQPQEESRRTPAPGPFQAPGGDQGAPPPQGAGRGAEARPPVLLRLSPAVGWSPSGHQGLGRPSSAAG